MKVIILGADKVSGSLAEHLARKENENTVVDTDVQLSARWCQDPARV